MTTITEPYKVSILVPVYGVEKYINRCARSIFEQTYQNLEIIFVDDCTPDHSIDIIKRTLEYYPNRQDQTIIISHKFNLGLAGSSNTANVNAHGAFIYHLDSDDYIEKDTIETLVSKQISTSADIISAHLIINENTINSIYIEPEYHSKDEMMVHILSQTNNHEITGRLIRRQLYLDNHLSPLNGQNRGEDWRMTPMLVYYANKIAQVNRFLYHYVMNDDSYIRSKKTWEPQKSALMQDYANYSSLVAFFRDKEKRYYDIVCEKSALKVFRILLKALKANDKAFYDKTHMELFKYQSEYIRRAIGDKLYMLLRLPFSYVFLPAYLKMGKQ